MAPPKSQPTPPGALVIFGAGGDLTKRLIIPALYNLMRAKLLSDRFVLVGVGHSEQDEDAWKKGLHDFLEGVVKKGGAEFEAAKIDEAVWDKLSKTMSFMSGGDVSKPATYDKLKEHLKKRQAETNFEDNIIFYLAIADSLFQTTIDELGKADMLKEDKGFRRIIIEKPFGHDLPSAKALNKDILKSAREEQIYRIDHFLGKETVQNIMALRFANGLFEPLWNRDRIDHVQITVAESIGIERRGKFYEATGALRDMVPNHLFQLLAMTAMEPPVSFEAEDVRAKKAEVFKAIHPLAPEDAVRGQYAAGMVDGAVVAGYRHEQDVAPESTVETYVAMRVMIDNWRWAGVPFYLRTGKRMSARSTEIAIRFKKAPYSLFRDTPTDELSADWMILHIQPDEGISLKFNAKRPGPAVVLEGVAMDFRYADWFKQASAVGYETLIYDCLTGDATLFQRADQIEAAWAVVQPVLDNWANRDPSGFPNYTAGSAGPGAADALIARDRRSWRPVR
ncbi:MAG TPA: glucose-6-phosphate dehydrogenase [Rhizomicrobium sp.]|jgi:glucose-6-phosphate 1-dehydrogenase|nr:glucose-6-phosphate dehydrogenase [Rhizomicrobium sp.]